MTAEQVLNWGLGRPTLSAVRVDATSEVPFRSRGRFEGFSFKIAPSAPPRGYRPGQRHPPVVLHLEKAAD